MKNLADPKTRPEILRRLATIRPDSRRVWGEMTPHEMVCHLADSYELAMGDRPMTTTGTLFQRTVIRFVALSTPLPWPRGYPAPPEVAQGVGGTPPEEFKSDVLRLQAAIDRFSRPDRDFEWGIHPYFGVLTPNEWLCWGYRHADHHLRQFGA
jgi:hypothetical protein